MLQCTLTKKTNLPVYSSTDTGKSGYDWDPDGKVFYKRVALPGTTDQYQYTDYNGTTHILHDANMQIASLIYKALPQEASVVFVDQNGKTVKATYNLPEGVTDGKLTASQLQELVDTTVKGYHLVQNPLTADFTYSADAAENVLTVVYALDEQKATINFNLQGKTDAKFSDAHPSITLIGTTGEKIASDTQFVQVSGNTYRVATEDEQSDDNMTLAKWDQAALAGYTRVSDTLPTLTFTFDGNDNHTSDNKLVAANDATAQTFNLGYTANATQVKVVYRVMQMKIEYDANGKTYTVPDLDADGNYQYRTVTPDGIDTSETGTFGDSYTVDVANKSLLNQGYEFGSVDYRPTSTNGKAITVRNTTQTGVDAGTANDITYTYFPDTYYEKTGSPKGTTVTKSIVNQLAFSEND